MEEKSKCVAFFDKVESLDIHYLNVLLESISEKSYSLYNDEKKFLKLLIEIESILEEGFYVSKDIKKGEFFEWNESYSVSLKELLKNCDPKDLQIAYILSMTRSLGLMTRADFESLITNTAFLMGVNGDLNSVISDLILPKLIKRYLENKHPQTRLQCIKLWLCRQYYGQENFDPQRDLEKILNTIVNSLPGLDRYTYRAVATKDPAYTQYLKSLTQFGKKDFLAEIPEDLRSSINAFLWAANSFYLNPMTNKKDRDDCLKLVTEVYEVTQKIGEIYKNTFFDRSALFRELRELSDKTDQIGNLADQLEESAPRDSLNWLKICLVSLFSALILTILWVIPSLTCCGGRNSFFKHPLPVIPRAQELVQRLEVEIQRLEVEIERQRNVGNIQDSERVSLLND